MPHAVKVVDGDVVFQSLIGRLVTADPPASKLRGEAVSIPYR